MRFYFNDKAKFMGFSYGVSGFSSILYAIGFILCITLFLPLYPVWYYFAMKYWDKLVVVDPTYDTLYHGKVKPRVFDMSKGQWKFILGIWFFGAITLLICM